MDIHSIKNLPAEELATLLEGENCGMEDANYMKPLTPEELADRKAQFTQLAIDKTEIDDEFAKVKEDFKARLKPLAHQISQTLAVIKQRGEWTTGKCYKIPDYDNKMMHIVNAEGLVINSRLMKPEERQFHISHSKAS